MSKKAPTILTLDAGGTNLVFSAAQDEQVLQQKVNLPASSENLNVFLEKIINGFFTLQQQLDTKADAISFCFPGPADYEKGIIGNLENLPFFRGGVPLAKILENKFKIPVFINNDGDLFTLGEAIEGLLMEINQKRTKQYKNLLGVTLGTGFGGGIVRNKQLFAGDNSAAAEINRMSNYLSPSQSVEETLSIRGIRQLYSKTAEIAEQNAPDPFEIYKIGIGEKTGNKMAALKTWKIFGLILGDALANAVSLTDSCVVIGGGLSGAHSLFLPAAIKQMNSIFQKNDGSSMSRMELLAFNWENREDRSEFLKDESVILPIPFSNETQRYYPKKKIAVGISKLGTSDAVAVGAYAFAVSKLGW